MVAALQPIDGTPAEVVHMPAEVPMTTQERAYTSPIWYTPKTVEATL